MVFLVRGRALAREDLPTIRLERDEAIEKYMKSHVLVGKLLAVQAVEVGQVRAYVAAAWGLGDRLKIHEQHLTNYFLFNFDNEEDKEMVMGMESVYILGSRIIMKEWPPYALLHEIDFSFTA